MEPRFETGIDKGMDRESGTKMKSETGKRIEKGRAERMVGIIDGDFVTIIPRSNLIMDHNIVDNQESYLELRIMSERRVRRLLSEPGWPEPFSRCLNTVPPQSSSALNVSSD
jgi:hypothetical protein